MSQSEIITGLEVCDEYSRPMDILSAWRSKFYVVFSMLTLFVTWCFMLYWNNRCYTPSLLLVTCWLPKNIPSQSTTALILSVFCNTQNVQRNQLQHLTSLLLLSVMQNCFDRGPQVRLADVTRVWITEAQLTCLLLCPSLTWTQLGERNLQKWL